MKKAKHNYKSSYTFMMIPNDEDNVKTYRFPKWIVKAIILLMIFILLVSSYFVHSFVSIKGEYAKKTKDMETLEVVNNNQKKQIIELQIHTENINSELQSYTENINSELQSYTQNINEKINSLNALENEVRGLVGLSTDGVDYENEELSILYSQANTEIELPSRSGMNRRNIDSSLEYDQSVVLQQIGKDLTAIEENLSQEEDNYLILKDDVSMQLDYLAAKPTAWPTNGRVTSSFGKRRAPMRGASTNHMGIDIANKYGSPIIAAGKGEVTFAGWKAGLGYTVILSHGYGFDTLYGHNSKINVEVGQEVEKGQIIARLGNSGKSTGPHVHFEIHVNGNPVDPMEYLDK